MWFLVVLMLAVPTSDLAGRRGAYTLAFGMDDKACSVRATVAAQQPGTVVAECVLGEVQAHQLVQEWISGRMPVPTTTP